MPDKPLTGETTALEHETVDRLANIAVTVVPPFYSALRSVLRGEGPFTGRISSSERIGLAWDVVRIAPSTQQAKLIVEP